MPNTDFMRMKFSFKHDSGRFFHFYIDDVKLNQIPDIVIENRNHLIIEFFSDYIFINNKKNIDTLVSIFIDRKYAQVAIDSNISQDLEICNSSEVASTGSIADKYYEMYLLDDDIEISECFNKPKIRIYSDDFFKRKMQDNYYFSRTISQFRKSEIVKRIKDQKS